MRRCTIRGKRIFVYNFYVFYDDIYERALFGEYFKKIKNVFIM